MAQIDRSAGEGLIDRQTVDAHLGQALQHLVTATVVIRHLERNARLDVHDRRHLAADIHAIGRMLDDVRDSLGSPILYLDIQDLQREEH